MAIVHFLGPIKRDSIYVDIRNLTQLRTILLLKEEDLKDWLDICAVAVNDTMVSSFNYEIQDNDQISLLPPVCGG